MGPPLPRSSCSSSHTPPLRRLCWNFSAGAEETAGSAVATQPYRRPSADSPVPRKGLISPVICVPAGLGTHVVWERQLISWRSRRGGPGQGAQTEKWPVGSWHVQLALTWPPSPWQALGWSGRAKLPDSLFTLCDIPQPWNVVPLPSCPSTPAMFGLAFS